jgi:hypothetical protein
MNGSNKNVEEKIKQFDRQDKAVKSKSSEVYDKVIDIFNMIKNVF